MFTKKDYTFIDTKYFDVEHISLYYIILKSKNTKHIWSIYSQCTTLGKRSLVISHKHHAIDQFHIQKWMHPKSVIEAQEMIKKHDIWHLKNRKK